MANRKNTFLIKRSNTPGKVPTAGDLLLGELALNTADIILYASGTTSNSILPIGWDRVARTGDTMTGDLYVPTISAETISATTYQNLPSPYKTTILTGGTSYTFTDFKVVNTLSINKTTGSTTTVTLNQTPNVNDFYVVKDRKGDSFTNQIVITGGTYTIDGNASVIMKSKNNPSLTFLFDGSEYIII
jgi:hypothetical protein